METAYDMYKETTEHQLIELRDRLSSYETNKESEDLVRN